MTPRQAELILQLTTHPGWKTYMELKEETLSRLREQADWDSVGILKLQGQIFEVKSDLGIQKKALAIVNKK